MKEDSSIIRFPQPDEIDDPLTALLRSGARRLLEQAIEAEVEAFLASRKELKLTDGAAPVMNFGEVDMVNHAVEHHFGLLAVRRLAGGRDNRRLRNARLVPQRPKRFHILQHLAVI